MASDEVESPTYKKPKVSTASTEILVFRLIWRSPMIWKGRAAQRKSVKTDDAMKSMSSALTTLLGI